MESEESGYEAVHTVLWTSVFVQQSMHAWQRKAVVATYPGPDDKLQIAPVNDET